MDGAITADCVHRLCRPSRRYATSGIYLTMTRSRVDFDTVRNIALALPGVEESTAYGSPALKVRGKLLACIPVNSSAEPGSLAVRINIEERADLIAAAPDVYYVTDHYADYDAVLVRLSRVSSDVLGDLLTIAYKFVTANAAHRSTSRKQPRSRR